jgi:hypothetical protein
MNRFTEDHRTALVLAVLEEVGFISSHIMYDFTPGDWEELVQTLATIPIDKVDPKWIRVRNLIARSCQVTALLAVHDEIMKAPELK